MECKNGPPPCEQAWDLLLVKLKTAQSGNVFAQDADVLAADMARKLALAHGGGGVGGYSSNSSPPSASSQPI
eukprot:scaffold86995_cov18-Tisochrysis_lutea.AAC.1